MNLKKLTPMAFGFAAMVTLAACGGNDDANTAADTGLGGTMAAPAPAPAPMTDTMMMDTTRRDTLMTGTGPATTPPPTP